MSHGIILEAENQITFFGEVSLNMEVIRKEKLYGTESLRS
jgi:hypothetical protein